jgi:hypothetical protein
MSGSFLKGAVLGLICALVGGVATVALGGSGIGAVFNLGQTNTVNAQSQLNGNTAGTAQLQVNNASNSAGSIAVHALNASNAAAVIGESSSTGTGVYGTSTNGFGVLASSASETTAALKAQNSGGGTAGSFVVNSGVAPLKVNSTTKVSNLNADQLDGLDSTQLQRRVSGTCAAGTAVRVVNADGSVSCQAAGPGGAVAYAHVSPNGVVDTAHAKNITQANVTHPQTGVYCFNGLSFTPNSIEVTLGGTTGDGTGPTVPAVVADIPSFSLCSSQGEVGMVNPSTGAFSRDASFWVVFN